MINEIDLTPTCSLIELPGHSDILKIRSWGDESSATAIALLVHGLGAHSAWFEGMARLLAERGMLVFAYDQKGFGSRGNLPLHSYKDWVYDLSGAVKVLAEKHPDKPFFLMGNSMGALVVMAASKLVKVDGIVIFSPGFEGFPGTFTLPYKIRALFSALWAPDREVILPYGFDIVTRDLAVRKWLELDPDKKTAVPGRMLSELLKLSNSVVSSLSSVNVPVLMFTAGVEKIVNNKVNLRLYGRLRAPSKEHVHLADAWHDLMFDPLIDEVANKSVEWAKSIVDAKSARHASPQ